MQVMFAGAAIVATLALCGGARLADADTVAASGTAPTSAHFGPQFAQTAPNGTGAGVIAVDDDTNPSSGDIFTQNAQDQSTA